uniref:BTB domain-containing protein n=1 Tax=Caenorhabditis tropicalis TaxID=1561998 RepID=A0A1I7U1H8_9PELO
MNAKEIIYKSQPISISSQARNSTLTISKGLTCNFKSRKDSGVKFSWEFNWEELKKTGIDGLSGEMTVYSPQGYFEPLPVAIDLKDTVQLVYAILPPNYDYYGDWINFDISLIPYYLPIKDVSYEEMFSPSEKNDTILLVEGKKMHVNRAFLSYHSDFFRGLFSSTSFDTNKTVDKLLEMADRFGAPSVIGIVEYHLINNSRIKNERMMWMADNYGMPELLEKTIREMSSIEKAKALKASPEYKKLSFEAKAKVLDRLMELI